MLRKGTILQKFVLLKYIMELYNRLLEKEEAKLRPKTAKSGPPQSLRKGKLPKIPTTTINMGDDNDATQVQQVVMVGGNEGQNQQQSIEAAADVPLITITTETGDMVADEPSRLVTNNISDDDLYLIPPTTDLFEDGTMGEKDNDLAFNFVGKYLDDIDEFAQDLECFNVDVTNSPLTMSQQILELSGSNSPPPVVVEQDGIVAKQTKGTANAPPPTQEGFHTPKTRYSLRPRSSALLASLAPDTPPSRRSGLRRVPSTETPQRPQHQRRRRILTEEEYSLRFPIAKRKIVSIATLPMPRNNISSRNIISYFPMDLTLLREEFSHELHGRSSLPMETSVNRETDPSLIIVSLEQSNNHQNMQHLQPPQSNQFSSHLHVSTLDPVRQADSNLMRDQQQQHLLVPPQPQQTQQSNISAMDDIRQAPSHMVMEEAAAGLTNLSLPLKMTSQKEVTENLPASALAGVSNDSLNLGNEEPVIPSGIPAPPPVDHSRGLNNRIFQQWMTFVKHHLIW
ncbi:uncharacterized protein [Musca autumnalis]|uniref:uncharacterized protein n=1 Tax=Musca autumnalis TaxID=221902 RepID=UPI003CEA5B86